MPAGQTKSSKQRFVIGIFLLVASIAVSYLVIDSPYRQHFLQVKDQVQQIESGAISADGGVAQNGFPVQKGDGVFDTLSCGPDVSCPYSIGGWVVPIEPGQEARFASDILSSLGYPNTSNTQTTCLVQQTGDFCSASGYKSNIKLVVSVQFADSFHNQIPDKDVSPKTWRYVTASAYYQ